MSETQRARHVLRSIGAVLTGLLVGIVPTLVTDLVLHKAGVFPPQGQPASDGALLLATVYRTIYGVASSYVAARLAPNRPMGHALVLGTMGFVVSTVGAVVTWNKVAEYGPHWYPLALVVLALPTAWVGGKLRVMQLQARANG
jgi:hypothetical protein